MPPTRFLTRRISGRDLLLDCAVAEIFDFAGKTGPRDHGDQVPVGFAESARSLGWSLP